MVTNNSPNSTLFWKEVINGLLVPFRSNRKGGGTNGTGIFR